jgi:hypothetical protein
VSDAEHLAEIIDIVTTSRIQRVEEGVNVDRIKLALDLRRKPAVLLCALVEGWDYQRIVKELY